MDTYNKMHVAALATPLYKEYCTIREASLIYFYGD